MRKTGILMLTILLFTVSCKKNDETDPRDQFIGNYTTNELFSLPDLNIYDSYSGTCIISKSAEADKIVITSEDGTTMTAKVSGNAYVYDKYIDSVTENGITMITEVTGSGTINGIIIQEAGIYKISANGETYTGTWSNTMTK